MTHYNLALMGFGNVGQAFARLLERKRAALAAEYGITFAVTGILTGRHGGAIDPAGIDLPQALAAMGKHALADLSVSPPPTDGLDFIRQVPAQVLFENTPVNHHTGQPALGYIQAALERGMHAVTANKGPVVHGYAALHDLAKQHGVHFLHESAVMDGAPIFSLFREPLPAIELRGFTGILNSCTNLLLGLMDAGQSFEQAVAYAQSIGIAETDPSADIDGWDAAIKVAALSTALMGVPLLPQQVARQGIRGITPQMLAQARSEGKRWKLVCRCRRDGTGVQAQVQPELVSPDSPLYSINGTSSYVQFETDCLPGLGIVEGNPGPETTAYGLLADFINAVRR